ncbi:MAG: hypothetical protein AAF363_21100 [Bacteroidota bacterium]
MMRTLLFISFVSLLYACQTQQSKSNFEGLWIVKSVKVGEQEMTPNARWTRFNIDSTQESGNGRFQHSYGTWTYNEETQRLSIVNENGLEDLNEPFQLKIEGDLMFWNRVEEGQPIEVILERSEKLPETYGDQLLGLWKLQGLEGNGTYFNEEVNPDPSDYMFLRWDKRFVIHSKGKRNTGVYNVHGHRPELELIPYGENHPRSFWRIDFNDDEINLELLNSDSTVLRNYKRIRKFPS